MWKGLALYDVERIVIMTKINSIAPSILAADFADLASALKQMEEADVDYVHCDVMDGRFVPAITFGSQAVAALHKRTVLPLDLHLMIVEPERHVEAFAQAGASIITFHPEACLHPARLLQQIHALDVKAGVALNPGTAVSVVEYLLPDCDMVLLMSVNPGAGGQKFIPDTLRKARELVARREALGLDFDIEVDGGIDASTAPLAREAGINILVAGTAFFKAEEKKAMVQAIRGH